MAPGFSAETTQAVAAVPGVAMMSPTAWGTARFDAEEQRYSAVDPATVERVLTLDISSGSVDGLDSNGLVVSAPRLAEALGGR